MKNTKPEIKVRKILHSMGYRFRLHSKDLLGSPDIVLPKYKTVILCMVVFGIGMRIASMLLLQKQGRNSGTKNSQKIKKGIPKFRKNKNLDWRSVVIWECETKNIENLRDKIIDVFN